jgi:hypothetical protein
VPAPASGDVLVINRYRNERPKAVVLNPDDYTYLREAAELVDEAGMLADTVSAGALEARELEDRPRDEVLVEDSGRIAELLDL